MDRRDGAPPSVVHRLVLDSNTNWYGWNVEAVPAEGTPDSATTSLLLRLVTVVGTPLPSM